MDFKRFIISDLLFDCGIISQLVSCVTVKAGLLRSSICTSKLELHGEKDRRVQEWNIASLEENSVIEPTGTLTEKEDEKESDDEHENEHGKKGEETC